MTWQTEYDNIFGIKHYQVCVGKKCTCHKEVKAFIQDLLDRKAREIERIKSEAIKYPMQGANPKLIHDFNLGYDKGLLDALSILKEGE